MSENASFPLRPYVGLIPFHEEDASFFFGREMEQEVITGNLLASRLTLLYGPSGVGKSSVLRAGVAHHLHQLGQQNMARRGKPKFVVMVFNTWRDDPLSGILASVEKSVRETLKGETVEPVAPGLPFVESLQAWSERVSGELLIILDQFEEYFLYHPDEEGEGTFAAEFARAVNTPGLSVNFIVSYRDDAHAKLDFFKGRIPNLFDNYLRIGHLDRDAAQDAIEKPIEKYNQLLSRGQSQVEIEAGLVEAVLSQVRAGEKYIGEAGQGVISEKGGESASKWEIETPYLQLVLTRLWDEEMRAGSHVLKLSTLNALGGARRIVQTHLDSAMSALSGSERAMGASIFNYLVTPSGTKIAQTVPDLSGYVNLSKTKEAQLRVMMEKLASGDKRILRVVAPPANQPDDPRYEVFHDVLAQAIIDWRRRYQARHDQRRLWAGIGIMAALVLLMGGLTTFALVQRSRARFSATEAVEQRHVAELQRQVAEQKSIEATTQKSIAEENAARAATSQAEAQQALVAATFAQEREETQKVKAVQAAKSNEALAVKNGELAHRAEAEAKHAKEQTVLAIKSKDEAEGARNRMLVALNDAKAAKEELEKKRAEAETLRAEAEKQRGEALKALTLVKTLDSSVPYFKAVMRGHDEQVNNAVYSPDGTFVVTSSTDGTARLWNPVTGEPKAVINASCKKMSVAVSPDSKYIATACRGEAADSNVVKTWDVGTSTLITTFDTATDKILGVRSVAFSPDSQSIVITAGNQPVAAVYRVKGNPKPVFLLRTDQMNFTEAVYSHNGESIITIDDESAARVWKASGGEPVRLLKTAAPHSSATLSPQGTYLFREGLGNNLSVLDAETGDERDKLYHEGTLTSFASSPDEKYVVLGIGETAQVWDVGTGKRLATLGGDKPAPSPASSSTTTASVETRCETQGHQAPLSSAAFSPDDKYIVTASADKTALVWDWRAGKVIAPLRGHTDGVLSAVFDKSGKYVLTASADQTARVWEVFSTPVSIASSRDATLGLMIAFDFESGNAIPISQYADLRSTDVYWQPSKDTTRHLVPTGKTRLASIGPRSPEDFEKISLTELQGLNYSDLPLSGSDDNGNQLSNGSVFAVEMEGDDFTDYAKVRVLEYGEKLKIRWTTYRKKKEGNGRITISTNPDNYPMSINGKPAGMTSTAGSVLDLPVGKHTIEVDFPETHWTREINIGVGRQYCIALNYDAKGMPSAAQAGPEESTGKDGTVSFRQGRVSGTISECGERSVPRQD
jgi:WD40 repeat protein